MAGPIPPHLASLTLTPAHDPDEAVEVLGQDAALVGDDRQRRALLEPAELVETAGRERLLDELDAEALEVGQQVDGLLRDPARVRVDADRPAEDGAHGLERREVLRSAALDLERREVGSPGGALGDHAWFVDADREIGRRDVGRQAAQLMGRPAGDLADEVVECDVDGASRRAVTTDRRLHGEIGGGQSSLARLDVADRRQQQREDDGHRLGRLAVEAIRIALPHPDDAIEPVVADLDHDGRHAVARVVVLAGDVERVAESQVQGLVVQPQGHPASTHGRASTASWTAGHSRSAPNRNGSSVGSPVSAATCSMIRRASSSSL